MPVVTAMLPDGPAASSGQVLVGDTIAACDDQSCEGKSQAVLASLFLGFPGSVCRLRLQGKDGADKTCSLIRRKVQVGGGRLSDAAGMIAGGQNILQKGMHKTLLPQNPCPGYE